jgi:ribosomal protein L5
MSSLLFSQDNLIKYPLIKPYNKTKLNNIVIQFSYNEVIKDKLALLPVYKTLMLLTGQKPKIIKAKDSIAAFKVRKNMEIGALVTIRHTKYNLLKLIILNLPKFKVSNYNISLNQFDLFHPVDQRTGANINLNISSVGQNNKNIKTSKNFYLSSLHLY